MHINTRVIVIYLKIWFPLFNTYTKPSFGSPGTGTEQDSNWNRNGTVQQLVGAETEQDSSWPEPERDRTNGSRFGQLAGTEQDRRVRVCSPPSHLSSRTNRFFFSVFQKTNSFPPISKKLDSQANPIPDYKRSEI